MIIIPTEFYSVRDSSTICCGKCWLEDIRKTKAGKYTGDEAVYEKDLTRLPSDEPIQCDNCLVQNEAYELESFDEF